MALRVFNHDGTLLAGVGADGAIHICDATSGKLLRDLSCEERVRNIAWGDRWQFTFFSCAQW